MKRKNPDTVGSLLKRLGDYAKNNQGAFELNCKHVNYGTWFADYAARHNKWLITDCGAKTPLDALKLLAKELNEREDGK